MWGNTYINNIIVVSKLTTVYYWFFSDLTAPDARSLRIGVNSFLDFVILSTETMEKFGPPVSESYSH